MIIHRIIVGSLEVNCYIVQNMQNSQAVVIDPGSDTDKILRFIDEHDLTVKGIFLTHGHFDHIGSVRLVHEKTGAPVYVHEKDVTYLQDADLNLSKPFSAVEITAPHHYTVKDRDILEVAKMQFEVIHTPGHTPGGVCYKMGSVLFTGDTLFKASMGRTDFPGGNAQDLFHSLSHTLKGLEDEVYIYPGHGPESTIGYEKTHNPYMGDRIWDM